MVPGMAHALPIAFQFTGVVTDPSTYAGIAAGDPITATLSYDTDTLTNVFEDADLIVYEGPFSYEFHVGPYTWGTAESLIVHKSGLTFVIGNPSLEGAFTRLSGVGLMPIGGALPTSLDFANVMDSDVQGVALALGARLRGQITGITQTQGPGVDPTPVPEPATLTLSALGLAALAARRRRRFAR
jgi:PEP-CTERM motif